METLHVLEMEEETERAKEADRGMGAGRRGGGGACGLDFSAPPPPPTPHSPVPQILSWGPQGRTVPSSCRGLRVCGREAGSHSPSSSSGPAGGGSSSPSCSFSSSCKTRRGSEPGHDRTVYSIILSLGCLTLGDSWAHSREPCPTAAWGPGGSDHLGEAGQWCADRRGERKGPPRAGLSTHSL